MSLMDPIADALITIKNSDMAVKKECHCRPASKLLEKILSVLKEYGYIKNYAYLEDQRDGIYKIELVGKINECRAIKPRYSVKKNEFEKYEKRYLPSKDVGILIVTTPEGVFAHRQVKEKKIGGKLLAYIY